MKPALLELDAVTRRYGGVTAVDQVSLTVGEGEVMGLVGPNGAGKTTLFNAVTGVAPASTGRVLFRGEEVTRLRPHRIARLGMARTFQNLRLFPGLCVRDNVRIAAVGAESARLGCAWRRGGDPHAARVTELLGLVGLREHADQDAATLSYGARKMLELARALATRPKLLLLDEPAAGLNDAESASFAALVQDLAAGGLTIVLVEHDMRLVRQACDRVAVLESGRLIANGATGQVLGDPRVQAAYLGTEAGHA